MDLRDGFIGLDVGGSEVDNFICVTNMVNVMTVAVNKRVMVMHPEITIVLVVHLQELGDMSCSSSSGPSMLSLVNESYFACFDGHNSVCD